MLVCGKCKSDQVQLLAWVDGNTREFAEWNDDGEMGWCNSCGARSDVKYLPDSLVNKWKAQKEQSDNEPTSGMEWYDVGR